MWTTCHGTRLVTGGSPLVPFIPYLVIHFCKKNCWEVPVTVPHEHCWCFEWSSCAILHSWYVSPNFFLYIMCSQEKNFVHLCSPKIILCSRVFTKFFVFTKRKAFDNMRHSLKWDLRTSLSFSMLLGLLEDIKKVLIKPNLSLSSNQFWFFAFFLLTFRDYPDQWPIDPLPNFYPWRVGQGAFLRGEHKHVVFVGFFFILARTQTCFFGFLCYFVFLQFLDFCWKIYWLLKFSRFGPYFP